MEINEWLTFYPSSWEHDRGRTTIKVEVRIYEQDGEIHAEPLYYKVLDRNDNVVLDNAHAGRNGDRLWQLVEYLISDEFNEETKTWYELEHPAFEPLRRERQIERAMDNEWHRRNVL